MFEFIVLCLLGSIVAGSIFIHLSRKEEIQTYLVIEQDSRDYLNRSVSHALSHGWVCIGGPALIGLEVKKGQFDDKTVKVWAQAMGHKNKGEVLPL